MKRFIIHQIWFYLLLAMDPEAICRIVKQHEDARNKVNQPKIERGLVNEPEDVKEAFVTESMKIQSSRLMLGFKINHYKKRLKNMYNVI